MGKTDPFIFKFYLNNLDTQKEYKRIGLFGQVADNEFTKWIKSDERSFYDLQLNNWQINDFPYQIEKSFDLIICTRCAYFCKHPEKMIESFYNLLEPGGVLFIDWGLGDHWRFKDYKIGWVKNKEHEFAYDKNNFLWSSIWYEDFKNHPEFLKFEKIVKKFGYDDVKNAIEKEVPYCLTLNSLTLEQPVIQYNILALWPESPQIYFLLNIKKA